MKRIVWGILRGIGRALGALLGGIHVEGEANVPHTGPALLVPNHLSDIDPPIVWLSIRRAPWFMAKSELFETRFLGPFIRFMQAFPVRRDSADRAALRFAEDRLREGEVLILFPEGRLSETGELMPFQPGAALLALRTGVPVIPVGLIGTQGMMPYGHTRPRRAPRPVQVRIGPPIPTDDLADLPRGEALDELNRRMEVAVARLADQPLPERETERPTGKGAAGCPTWIA